MAGWVNAQDWVGAEKPGIPLEHGRAGCAGRARNRQRDGTGSMESTTPGVAPRQEKLLRVCCRIGQLECEVLLNQQIGRNPEHLAQRSHLVH
jgi:hypothetical protein